MKTNIHNRNKVIAAACPMIPDEDIEEIQLAVNDILRSGWLILGEHTHSFEEEFRTYIGVEHAVAVSSCTAAIQIVLRYHQIQGHEVIVPTNNFIGVVSAVIDEGGVPVLADMDPETFCVDTEDLLARITPRTVGVIVVHIAGLVYPEIDQLRTICKDKGLFLLEDASNANGAEIDGRKAGSLTDVACFSFYPTKIMTTGTGGMITTRNASLAEYARSVRHHGVGDSLEEIVNLGNDWCLSEINAVLGRSQLKRLDENVAHRNHMVARYRQGLKDLQWLNIPDYPENFRHAYYKFPVLIREGMDKEQLRRILYTEYHIENGNIYDPPCHLQPVLRKKFGYCEGMYPKAESTLRRQICPPIHSALTEQEVDRVIEAMVDVGNRFGSM
jgi:dTDP-4-amino-4,6-dideoxygalactose transaminase